MLNPRLASVSHLHWIYSLGKIISCSNNIRNFYLTLLGNDSVNALGRVGAYFDFWHFAVSFHQSILEVVEFVCAFASRILVSLY